VSDFEDVTDPTAKAQLVVLQRAVFAIDEAARAQAQRHPILEGHIAALSALVLKFTEMVKSKNAEAKAGTISPEEAKCAQQAFQQALVVVNDALNDARREQGLIRGRIQGLNEGAEQISRIFEEVAAPKE